MDIINLQDAIVEIVDGTTPTAKVLEIPVDEGELRWSIKNPLTYRMIRQKLGPVQRGPEAPMEVTIRAVYQYLSAKSDATVPTVYEALTQTGKASTWKSTAQGACEPYCVDLRVTYTPPCSDLEEETILFKYFRPDNLDFEVAPGTLSLPGKCNSTRPIITRAAQT